MRPHPSGGATMGAPPTANGHPTPPQPAPFEQHRCLCADSPGRRLRRQTPMQFLRSAQLRSPADRQTHQLAAPQSGAPQVAASNTASAVREPVEGGPTRRGTRAGVTVSGMGPLEGRVFSRNAATTVIWSRGNVQSARPGVSTPSYSTRGHSLGESDICVIPCLPLPCLSLS